MENPNIKKFYQQSAKPFNYVPNDLVSGDPALPPTMSGLMRIDPDSGNIWISAGKTLVSDWKLVTGGGGDSGAIAIQYNGDPISATATVLNFVGGLTVSGDPLVTIDIPTGPVIFKNTNSGADVKNTFERSLTYSQTIPANTVKPGSIIKVTYRAVKNPLANNGSTAITISIGPSFVAAPNLAVGVISWSFANPNTYGQIKREFVVDSSNTTKFITNKSSIFSDDTEAGGEEVGIIDWTVNQTFYFGIQHIDSAVDSAAGSFYCIEIY